MKRSIYIDGRHWDNIMALPCVRGLIKRSDYEILVKVKVAKVPYIYAGTGDALVEDDAGNWHVRKKESMVPRRLKTGYMLCPYYYAWIETNYRGLQLYQCIAECDSEPRKCEWTPEKGCFKYPKGGQE